MKRSRRGGQPGQRRADVAAAPRARGRPPGRSSTKSLNITSRRSRAKPSATNLSSAARSCTSTASASPRRATSSAWPVPERHHPHLDAGGLPEQRQEVAEEAGLLGGRGGGQHDEALLGCGTSVSRTIAAASTARRRRAGRAQQARRHGNSPLRNCAAGAGSGSAEEARHGQVHEQAPGVQVQRAPRQALDLRRGCAC
jgi:hypothetical protein